MEVLNPAINVDAFFDSLSRSNRSLLLLDYDGTLAPFKVERDQAFLYPGFPELIDEIMECSKTRIVIISGRTIQDLVPLLKLRRIPELWGSHGWERLIDGEKYVAFDLEHKMIEGLAEARKWVEKEGYEERSESKHGCLTLHWRGLNWADASKMRLRALEEWTPIAQRAGLEIIEFGGGIELRAPGRNKGEAVKKILSESGDVVLSYLGDDNTDEDAFKALGRRGLSVLVNEVRRPTAADLWLKPPDELRDFLEKWRDRCRG
jgi:trehalose 6-phosphate phosphatase